VTASSTSTRGSHRRPPISSLSIGLVAALVVVAVVLALPAPPVRPDAGPAQVQGLERLRDLWPDVAVTTIPAALPDGALYTPTHFLDATTSIGVATPTDRSATRLVIHGPDGALRTLRTLTGTLRPTIAAVAASGDSIYWIEGSEEADGRRRADVWQATIGSGEPRRIATDFSEVLFYDSAYDLQISGGRLHWAALVPESAEGTEIHSVALTGGRVRVRKLDDVYALTAWPWATTGAAAQPGNIEMLNLVSGERRTVRAGPNEILTCTPSWCRVTTLVDLGQSITVELARPDGSERRRVGGNTLMPLNPDVALVDRFEVLAGPVADPAAATQRLWLHDLATSRSVLLADTATGTIGSRGGYLWWSTGDNEVAVWHVLDLRTLS
jgi:hypothetical protein